jgi:hypothetical protein
MLDQDRPSIGHARPQSAATASIDGTYRAGGLDRTSRGLVPRQMEDKWFVFVEDQTIYPSSELDRTFMSARSMCGGRRTDPAVKPIYARRWRTNAVEPTPSWST